MITDSLLHSIGGCLETMTLSHGLVISLFTAGLVGGVTHCAAMCGPFVISQTKSLQKKRALLPYHFGRITTYILMSMLLASVLNLAFLFLPIRNYIIAPILMIAGTIFLVTAFPKLIKIFPWALRLQSFLPQKWLSPFFNRLNHKTGIIKEYLLGVLLGFMPCGLILSALMAASTAPTPLGAGLAMLAFGLGTMPALIGIGFGGSFLLRRNPVLLQRIRQGAMIWSGLWLFALAGFILI